MKKKVRFKTVKIVAFMLLLSLATLVAYTKLAPSEPEIVVEHEHSFSEEWAVTIPSTETEEGEESNVCDECGETVTRPLEKLHVHSYAGDWTVKVAPTMKKAGSETNVCIGCGKVSSRAIPKLAIKNVLLTGQPAITTYFTGEYFNSYGVKLTAVLENGETTLITDYKIKTSDPLTASMSYAIIEYGEFTVKIPITVSSAILASVSDIASLPDGKFVYANGVCIGNVTLENGEKAFLLKHFAEDDIVMLKNAKYDYKVGDKLRFYATVASDETGKHLVFSPANTNPAAAIESSGNLINVKLNDTKNITNFSQLNEALSGTNAEQYSHLTFDGVFYITKMGDYYAIHFNSAATSADDIKAEDGKYVLISPENINDSMLKDRLDFAGNDFPGVPVSGKINAAYVCCDANNYYLSVIEEDWIRVDYYREGHEHLTEIAYAFYYQLPQVDYDQYNTRRNINPTPEDATAQQRIYLDCSSYVNAVYYNAFGVNILPYTISEKSANTANYTTYARENPGAVDVIGYWESADYPDKADQKALLKSLLNQLQVGDVIVYRKASSGHALIYVGDGKILHCMNTGSYTHNGENPLNAYDSISLDSIGFETTENLFENDYASRYLFKYVNFSILRPMNRGLTLTEQAQKRMTIPSLSIEKTVDVTMYSAVYAGDVLTYTITLKNNAATALDGVTLSEFVPAGTEFVSASEGVTHNEGAIGWSGTVNGKATVTLSFSVRVTATATGALIESNAGAVNGLYLNKITNTVASISREKLGGLLDAANELVGNETSYSDPIAMINEVYSSVIGANLLAYANVSEALADIISVENKKYNENCAIDGMVIENLSGGYAIKGTNPTNNDRIRDIRLEYLSAGDVIIAEHTNENSVKCYTGYVYLGDTKFLAVNSVDGTCEIVTYYNADFLSLKNILTSLYSYEKYAIIRPSMAISAE